MKNNLQSGRHIRRIRKSLFIILIILAFATLSAYATENQDNSGMLNIEVSTGSGTTGISTSIQLVLLFTILSLAPSILIMMTSFIRIIIVLHFARSALGTQQAPPNQVLVGLALFLTFFIMAPVFSEINNNAIQPYINKELTQKEAIDAASAPLKEFMMGQVNEKDLTLFVTISGQTDIESYEDIPMTTVIPAFIISELRAAFIIGFLIYIPFIIIDMVVASVLMAMGMMMLPPAMISLPFKILLFVMIDGWGLLLGELVKTFY